MTYQHRWTVAHLQCSRGLCLRHPLQPVHVHAPLVPPGPGVAALAPGLRVCRGRSLLGDGVEGRRILRADIVKVVVSSHGWADKFTCVRSALRGSIAETPLCEKRIKR